MGMKILIQGSGGREYSIASHAASYGHDVYVTPGNPAIESMGIGRNVPYSGPSDCASYAEKGGFDLVIAGPEDPLAAGLGDLMKERGVPFFGPLMGHAKAESDKGYWHELLETTGLMPGGKVFQCRAAAKRYLSEFPPDKYVIKSTELRAGKGVYLPNTAEEQNKALKRIMSPSGWGDPVLLQERVEGVELSSMTIVGKGHQYVTLASSKDNKAVGINEFGLDPRLNTGGMGTESPHPVVPEATFIDMIDRYVDVPIELLEADADIGPFVGVLYNGLIKDRDNLWILESNIRYGDPEIQPILMRTRSDLTKYMKAAVDGKLSDMPPLKIDPRPAVYLVIATPGYPTSEYKKHTGKPIRGIDIVKRTDGMDICFAGVGMDDDGKLVNSGGRVFGVGLLGDSRDQAWDELYGIVDGGNGIGLGNGAADTQFRKDLKDAIS